MELTWAKNRQDLEEIAELMAKVFVQRSYFDFYRTRMDYQTLDPDFLPEHSRIVREDGRIVSHVSIITKYMRIGGSVVKLGGIGDVCTHPDCRGKSYSRALMQDAVRYMGEHDYALSMLYGIKNYYHKFGYIEAMGRYLAWLPTKFTEGLEVSHTLRPSEPGDTPRLNELYNRAYGHSTGAMRRSEAHWYKINVPERITVALDRQGRIAGYGMISPTTVAEPYIQEAAVPDLSVARSLLAHYGELARKRLQPEIEFHIECAHPLIKFVRNLGGRFTTRLCGEGEGQAMLRVIDLNLTLNAMREELEARLAKSSLSHQDFRFNILTEDCGKSLLDFHKGKIELSPEPDLSAPGLKIPQNLLVRSLIGYWSVDQIPMRDPQIEISPELQQWLEVLFPLQEPVTGEADFF
jgi:predicted N-acetyltransferase YhbS